jgi:hypothetical protein
VILEITPEDVRLATEQGCPVGNAARRLLGDHALEAESCNADHTLLRVSDEAELIYSKHLAAQVARFDAGLGFQPGRYRLTRI